jgi:hypothetical protein
MPITLKVYKNPVWVWELKLFIVMTITAYERTEAFQKFTPIEEGLPDFTLPSEHVKYNK